MSSLRLILSILCVLQELAAEALSFAGLSLQSRTALIAENLFLRKQLAFYQEHEIRPRRLTNGAGLWLFSGRASLLGDVLLVIVPATLIDWRRKAFQLFWK